MKKRKKIFFDEEFTGLHQDTTLISIGLISECGKKFYAEFNDFDRLQIDKWLIDNVLSKTAMKGLSINDVLSPCVIEDNGNINMVGNTEEIKLMLTNWLESFGCELEMWSDCLHYDWVLFINIFGNAFDLPKCVYYIPFDICTLFLVAGLDPDINRETFVYSKDMDEINNKHNALWDAKIIRRCYTRLSKIYLPQLI